MYVKAIFCAFLWCLLSVNVFAINQLYSQQLDFRLASPSPAQASLVPPSPTRGEGKRNTNDSAENSRAKSMLDIQYWTTPNGARVYFVATPDLPMLDIKVAFDAGSARDGNQEGLALLTNSMMGEGATNMTADQIAAAFGAVGARFSHDADHDMSVISLRTLTDPQKSKPALQTFTTVLSKPIFLVQDFSRVKQQILTAIAANQQSPATMATEALYQQVFGDHPYAHPILGQPKTIRTLKISDLQAFYRRYYVARNAIIVLVGAITPAQAKQIAKQIAESLSEGSTAPALPLAQNSAISREGKLIFPVEQIAIRVGQVGINRHSPDYFPLIVGNYILGGGSLVSRLGEQVREKRGLSYSVYSFFEPLAARGLFMIALETRADQADRALRVVQETLKNYIARGPTAIELKQAQQNLIGGFPLRFDSNDSIANNLLMLGFYRMPLDYLDKFRERVAAVTAAQIRDAFKRNLDINRMMVVKTMTRNDD